MIDCETAKTIVVERFLAKLEDDLRTPAVLIDEKTEEHDWGWMFYWQPKDLTLVPEEEAKWGYSPIIVDRLTGNFRMVGSVGPKLAIAALLWDRPKPE